ncbi:MAG: hypothetical protein IT373_38205 [Polyangiaceae bacterium]|nr:hypothetical protein [Polyangiaceae bacterium]
MSAATTRRRARRRRAVGLTAVAAALLAGGVGLGRWLRPDAPDAAGGAGPGASASTAPARPELVDAVPAGALLFVALDVPALRATPLGERFFGPGRGLDGLGGVAERCGFEPATALTELGFAVPDGPGGDFLLVAGGDFDAAGLVACAEKMLVARGAGARRRQLADFTLVGGDDEAGALAVRAGGPLLVSKAALLERAIGAAGGRAPSLRDDPIQAPLRALVGTGAVVASARLSPEQRALLAEAVQGHGLPDVFASVTGAAAALRLGATFELRVALGCTSAATARDLAAIVEGVRRQAEDATTPVGRLVARLGLGATLAALRVGQEGEHVGLTLRLTPGGAAGLFDLALALLEDEPPAPPASAAPPAVSAAPSASAAASGSAVPSASAVNGPSPPHN